MKKRAAELYTGNIMTSLQKDNNHINSKILFAPMLEICSNIGSVF